MNTLPPGSRARWKPARVAPAPPSPPAAAPVEVRLQRRSALPQKARGADLRASYRLTLQFGLIAALSLLIALFRGPFRSGGASLDVPLQAQEVVQMEDIQQTKQVERPPAPPRPPVPVEVPDDVILDEEDLNLDATLDLDEAVAALPPPPPPAEVTEPEVEAEIFMVVEEMPEIIGGMQRLYSLLEYPDIARQAGLEGQVIVRVVVGTDGVPSMPEVVRSAGEVLDMAAVAAVMQLRFKPGRQRGRPVRVRMALPIRFKLRAPKKQ